MGLPRSSMREEKESRKPSGEGKTVKRLVVPPKYKRHIRVEDNEAVLVVLSVCPCLLWLLSSDPKKGRPTWDGWIRPASGCSQLTFAAFPRLIPLSLSLLPVKKCNLVIKLFIYLFAKYLVFIIGSYWKETSTGWHCSPIIRVLIDRICQLLRLNHHIYIPRNNRRRTAIVIRI